MELMKKVLESEVRKSPFFFLARTLKRNKNTKCKDVWADTFFSEFTNAKPTAVWYFLYALIPLKCFSSVIFFFLTVACLVPLLALGIAQLMPVNDIHNKCTWLPRRENTQYISISIVSFKILSCLELMYAKYTQKCLSEGILGRAPSFASSKYLCSGGLTVSI